VSPAIRTNMVLAGGVGARQFEVGKEREFVEPFRAGMSAAGLRPEIVREVGDKKIAAVRALMREYAGSLGVDLSYQNFERELASLPGEYAAPGGALLLALAPAEPIGCVAMRALELGFCEMKRLYVRPAWRSTGLGRQLVEAILVEARRAGHRFVRLDTLPTMTAARKLYASMGFRPVAPYYHSPVAGTSFLQLEIRAEL
jgi:GNAT superfamily N-acetyltransferase